MDNYPVTSQWLGIFMPKSEIVTEYNKRTVPLLHFIESPATTLLPQNLEVCKIVRTFAGKRVRCLVSKTYLSIS